jgi:hypothetical protein
MRTSRPYLVLICLLALLASACGGRSAAPGGASPAATVITRQASPAFEDAGAGGQVGAASTASDPVQSPDNSPDTTEAAPPQGTPVPSAADGRDGKKPVATSKPPAVQKPAPVLPTRAGVVRDAATGKPVPGAWVYLGERIVRTDARGRYGANGATTAGSITVMKPGYAKYTGPARTATRAGVALRPFKAKAVFQPFYHTIGRKRARKMLKFIKDSPALNAIVIDVKSEDGKVWDSDVPLAEQIDATTPVSLERYVREAHAHGVYVIGRVTIFKDHTLGKGRPDLAIRSTEGGAWKDYAGNRYANPFNKNAWKYIGDIAVEAARKGVDEIQYDYVRFPVDGDLDTADYGARSTRKTRPRQIRAFLQYMEQRLRKEKVFISADVFGRIVFHPVDVYTGQRLEDFAQHVDFVSAMLYPSGFNRGSGGFDIPTRNSYGLIKKAQQLTNRRLRGKPALSRPWLQSFYDYGFGEPYKLPQFLEQRRAAEDTGSSGWLYWNAAGKYDPRTFVANP